MAAEDELRLILDGIPALVNTTTPTGAIEFANRQMLEYFGLGLAEIQHWPALIHPDDLELVTATWAQSVETGNPFDLEYRLRRSDGVYRWFSARAVPVRAEDGAIIRWYDVLTDIDDRRRAQDIVRASELQFRTTVDGIPGLIALIGAHGEVEFVNRGCEEYFGRTLEELQGWRSSDTIHPDDLPGVVAGWERAWQTGELPNWEYRLRRADGVYRWFLQRGLPMYDGGVKPKRWYCLTTDIHDRKLAEEALRRNEAALLEVQHLSKTGGWRWDTKNDVVDAALEVQRAAFVQPGEDPSQPAFWFGRVHPEDRARVEAEFSRCVQEKCEYRNNYRHLLPDGRVRFQSATGRPVLNEAGELVEFFGASMDVTEYRLAVTELERASQAVRDLQLKISRAAQIATVGELAASIAHEVNQPLAAVVANADTCLRWLSSPTPNVAKAVEAAERIVKDGKDAGEVVRRVRALFRRTTTEKVQLNVNSVIQEVLRLLDSYPARKHVALEANLSELVPEISADRVQLQQLVLNLVLNALEAVEPVSGRTKRVSIHSSASDSAVTIRVVDNGVGMADSDAAFETFFTTKPDGMGLGLAICRSIVAAHDGSLSAQQNPDFGMTFALSLPVPPVPS